MNKHYIIRQDTLQQLIACADDLSVEIDGAQDALSYTLTSWQSIDVSPKKSGIYLVCNAKTQDIWTAAFNDGTGKNKDTWGDDRGVGWVQVCHGVGPTHWMLLPEPPVLEGEANNG